jgi:hypothetical protein
MRVPVAICGGLLFASIVSVVWAQDAVKVDPTHYSVISENGPHEKSVMHSHPNSVAVMLTDMKAEFTLADGKKQNMTAKAGDAQYTPAQVHLPENTGDNGMDLILVELKK